MNPPSFIRYAIVVCLGLSTLHLIADTSPSTTVDPYIESHLPDVTVKSILTVDDGTIPDSDGGTTRLVGIPDGIGVIDGADLTPAEPDFFYLLVNHELNSTQGVERDHGEIGAFVSKWKINKTTHEVVEGDDLIKTVFDWDEGTDTFLEIDPGVGDLAELDRLCSSDLPLPTALFNSVSGKGTSEIIYLNGEETSGGRAFAHIVTGADAGKSYHLEHMGFAAFENVLASPFEQDKTVVILTDDAGDGEVYIYVGEKSSTGLEVEKAGLVGGTLYGLKIEGKPFEMDEDLATAVGPTETFTLAVLGSDGDRPADGAEVESRGEAAGTLKMGGPEDGAWDTRSGFEDTFYFATKGTESNGLNAVTRLWKLVFNDISDPTLGGTMTLLLDGPANRLGSLDNMAFEVIGGEAKLYLQEDLGSDSRLSKIWEYDIATGQLEEIAEHVGERFFAGGSQFLTTNEESSGVVSLKDVLGEGWFAASIQVHTSVGLSDSSELVEHGQLVLIDISGRGTDTLREQVIASGDDWAFRVDGVAPSADWNEVGFVPDASWNKDTAGTDLGVSPSLIGYGESAGRLATDLVQPDEPRAAAYYFRREFDVADPAAVALLDLYAKVDDGAVFYINGVEVARYNMNLDLEVGNDTFASENEPSERDWKLIPLTCDEVTLQATGNVLAVSVHQENSGSSDMRFDAELFVWNASPDAGDAPVTPANLTAGEPTTESLTLTWDAQIDAKFFRIERQQEGEVAWGVIEAEVPGTFTSYVDEDLDDGAAYRYRISAFNIHGASACSEVAVGETEQSDLFVIVEEGFDSDLGIFTAVDVAAPDRNFQWVPSNGGSAEGNNFGGDSGTEDWLITTDPIAFDFFSAEQLFFEAEVDFSGPAPLVLYSTDYDPETDTDPNTATWTQIVELPGAGEPTDFGPYDLSSIEGNGYIAFKYTGLGGAGGQSVRLRISDFLVTGDCGFDFVGAEDSDIEADGSSPWTVFNLSSELGWRYDTRDGMQGAVNNNFGSEDGGVNGGTTSDDWLISPEFTTSNEALVAQFMYYENFGDTLDKPLIVYVTNNYTGDPTTTTWQDITPPGLNGSTSDAWIEVTSLPFGISGSNMRLAFQYLTGGNGGGTTKRIGIDLVCFAELSGPLDFEQVYSQNGASVSFAPNVSGGTPPYTFAWDFGDGGDSDDSAPTHVFGGVGSYEVTLTVTDSDASEVEKSVDIEVTSFETPELIGDIRVATFNASMNRGSDGDLADDLDAGDDTQIAAVAEVIQRAKADIILINEFDLPHNGSKFDWHAAQDMIDDFRENYLEVAQAVDTDPIVYDYCFVGGVNTGVPSGFDLNNDGDVGGPNDAFGFGTFPGQYGMVLLSKYPIDHDSARTFQNFLWKDMPDAFLPPDPDDSDEDEDTSSYYNEAELAAYRLSSKSHWDVPVKIGKKTLHILASHPTPPVFDDGEAETYPDDIVDWNGLRNHDEIRFWADYINPSKSGYIYDDAEWKSAGNATPSAPMGGLYAGANFVIAGDQNADPVDGDATFNPILMLLDNPLVQGFRAPSSEGALEQVNPAQTDRDEKTASFDLRADYVLASSGLNYEQDFVYWPLLSDVQAPLLGASDHRLVAVDLSGLGFAGEVLGTYRTGLFDESAAEIVAYDPESQRLFVVNANDAQIDILDASDPTSPTKIKSVDFDGAGVNSVAISYGIVAVAVENEDKQAAGSVAFMDADGNILNTLTAGALPDMVTFNRAGTKVLVANEGEPDDDYAVDPEGSVTIVDLGGGTLADIVALTQDDVTQVTFESLNAIEHSLRNKGVRIFGPGATVAQDLEPEYIAVSPDDSLAFVAMQENNALAIIDLSDNSLKDVIALGTKDHSRGLPVLTEYEFAQEDLPVLGTSTADDVSDVLLGGFSGLWYEDSESTGDTLVFYVVPDRGPNGDAINVDGVTNREFLVPTYQARAVRIELHVDSGEIAVTDQILFTRKDGTTPITGIPNIPGYDEVPLDGKGDPVDYDPYGADMEGVLINPGDGTFWTVDEYRPAIYNFAADGTLIERYVPEGTSLLGDTPQAPGFYGAETLPAEYSNRRPNRGFEAVALDTDSGILYAFIQTPMDNPDTSIRNGSDVIRILGIDPADGTPVAEYVYLLERNALSGHGFARTDKIGDAVYAGGGRFYVMERDSSDLTDGLTGHKYIFEIDLTGATNLLAGDAPALMEGKTLEEHSADDLASIGVQPVFKSKVLNLPSIGYIPTDKPEGLALLPSGSLAVTSDNDFTQGGFETVSIGIIDFAIGAGIDASNEDGEINIANWPVYGLFLPDAIAAYEADGETYIVTANEGDSRDYDGFGEEERVKDLTLDPARFPDAESLQADENLGRLKTTSTLGDLDGDGDYDRIFSYGSRSFSIFDVYGNLVYDSGDEFEQRTAQLIPEYFNSSNDETGFDDRSDDKGPEPEAVEIGVMNGRTYAFIGLERVGGIMVYDISMPWDSHFVAYLNNRDWEGDPEADEGGDLGPEGLEFIAAADSPTRTPLLVVSNEVSGSTTIYDLSTIMITAPTDIAIVRSLNGDVTVSWQDAADNEDNYVVERYSTADGGWVPIGTVGADMTYFVDTNAENGTSYKYRVFAASGGVYSPIGAIAEIFIPIKPGSIYFGTITSGGPGNFALYIRPNGTAVFMAYNPESDTGAFNLNVEFADDGSFTFSPQTNNLAEFTGISVFAEAGEVSGSVSGNSVSVAIANFGPGGAAATGSGTREPDTGPAEESRGFYQGVLSDSSDGVFYQIVGASGRGYAYFSDGETANAGSGFVGSGGQFLGVADDLTLFELTIEPDMMVTGNITDSDGEVSSIFGFSEGEGGSERLVNSSSRGVVNTGESIIIQGFVLNGPGQTDVIVRGVGPGLEDQGVSSFLVNPRIEVYDSIGVLQDSNETWGDNANVDLLRDEMSRVGAFALEEGSDDAALLLSLDPGLYTVQMKGVDGETGVGLIELYDADAENRVNLANLSSRNLVGTGEEQLILGFVVSGEVPKKVLIRASGPALEDLGVSNFLADPMLTVYNGQSPIATNDNWEDNPNNVAALSVEAGAEAYPAGSKDAAVVLWLEPGIYTAVVSGVDASTGIGLVEVFELE